MSKATIEAVFDKIVVVYLRKTTSSAGIVIPDMAQDAQGYGKVLSVGSAAANQEIKEGDYLVFHTRAGMDMIQDKRVLKCLKYEEVYGILHDDDLIKRLAPIEFKASTEPSKIVSPGRGGIVVA